jgi:hypothetical protein
MTSGNKGENMPKNTFDETRIKDAVEKAEGAFWTSIAKDFPEIKSGDLPPVNSHNFTEYLNRIVKLWLYLNGEIK